MAIPPTCEQVECELPAHGRMFWPGERPLLVCLGHAVYALRVASALGFSLTVEALVPERDEASRAP